MLKAVFVLLCCFFSFSFSQTESQTLTKLTCPANSAGGKETPSKGENLHDCKLFECDTCCTEEVTGQLAKVPLGMVGKVDYAQCGGLTDACSEETSYLQCFYQCSPNLTPWINPTSKKVSRIPICASFCDAWFNKCQFDETCATGNGNWMTMISKDEQKVTCRGGQACRNYTTIYENGENLCNIIWGDLFIYTPDDQLCLHPSDPKRNAEAIKKHYNNTYPVETCFPEAVSYTDAGLIVGIVFGVLAGLCLIAAAVFFLLNRNTDKKEPKSSKNVEMAPPEEMATLQAGGSTENRGSDSDRE